MESKRFQVLNVIGRLTRRKLSETGSRVEEVTADESQSLGDSHRLLKRTYRLKNVVSQFDTGRTLFPQGILSRIGNVTRETLTVRRIEYFARKTGDSGNNETYGIIRDLHVAYSSERQLLEMADVSNGVVHVRSLESISKPGDRLVLKRSENVRNDTPRSEMSPEQQFASIRPKTPSLKVSSNWLDKMELGVGDRLIVSNPIEEFAVPPPEASGS